MRWRSASRAPAGRPSQLEARLGELLSEAQQLRSRQHDSEQQLEELRARRDRTRAELLSLEALQQAALGEKDPSAAAWLNEYGQRAGSGAPTRVAAALVVEAGWEHAVETVLGDYLEAVCVGDLDQLGDELQRLERATITFLETSATGKTGGEGTLAARAQGPDAAVAMLARVQTCDSLAQALLKRRHLQRGESLVTPNGEWLGRDWLRLRRGGDPHAGVLERAQRLKQLTRDSDAAAAALQSAEAALAALRERSQQTERARNELQGQVQAAHREHGELRVQLGAMQARRDEAQLRRMRLEGDRGEVDAELARARAGLAQAQSALDEALAELQRLDSQHPILTDEREQHRESTSGARSAAQTAQLALREAMIRHESRRSTLESMQTSAARLLEQRAQLLQRHETLSAELADGDAPVQELRVRLQSALDRRVEVETDLANARQAQEDADLELRATRATPLQRGTARVGRARGDGRGAHAGTGIARATRVARRTVRADAFRTRRDHRGAGGRGDGR